MTSAPPVQEDKALRQRMRLLNEMLEQNFPDPKALDEWVPHTDHQGQLFQ